MGYYATGSGTIVFRSGYDVDAVEKILEEMDGYCPFDRFSHDVETGQLEVGVSEKYYEEETKEVLKKLEPYVEQGEIEYEGEDGSIWRYVFFDGTFHEEDGRPVYESQMAAFLRRQHALIMLLSDMADQYETAVVRKNAHDILLTDEDLKELGFDYLIPEETEDGGREYV